MSGNGEALRALREKVADGTLSHLGGEHTLAAMPRDTWEPIVKANSGSLDAALSLHNAMLPEWTWIIRASDQEDWRSGRCRRGQFLANMWNDHTRHPVWADNPARAWLLAILDALISKEPADEA